MKVEEVFTREPGTCGPDSSISAAAWIMWERDCGTVPVVDGEGKVVGMISDRDITIAAITKERSPSEVNVREVMTGSVCSCRPSDDVQDAMKLMAMRRVRRLPVVDPEGKLLGILSITDLARRAAEGKLPADTIVRTFTEICTPWKKTVRRTSTPAAGPAV